MVTREDPELFTNGREGAEFELLPTEEVLMRGAAVPKRGTPCCGNGGCCMNGGAGVDWKTPTEEGWAPATLPGRGGNCRVQGKRHHFPS